MKAIRRRNTQSEIAVCRLLHAAGLRYRVDYAPLVPRRRADAVFTRKQVAILIDGFFWHGCPQHFSAPQSNTEYWDPKITRNRECDVETTRELRDAAWAVLRYWEHEPPGAIAQGVIRACGRVPEEKFS